MAEDTEPTFQVDVSSRPILVLIKGRANFLNCSPLRTFFQKMFEEGQTEFLLNFSDCSGMDSTFLGILAGAAIEARRRVPHGEIQLMGLSDRNLELVKNLGLQRLVNLVETLPDEATSTGSKAEGLNTEEQTEDQKKKMLIGAHENLVKIDDENLSKFQDLLRFLKNED